MTGIRRAAWTLAALLLLLGLGLGPGGALAVETAAGEIQASEARESEALAGLEAQQQELLREVRRLHRELAALREELARPGAQQIFGGIGYILGLCGVAFFFMGRKKSGGDR